MASANKNPVIRSGHLLVALLTAPDLYQIATRASSLFDLFPIDPMKHKFLEICEKVVEQQEESKTSSQADELEQAVTPTAKTQKHLLLDQYTINLTEKAKNGRIDPVIGREYEIRLMLDILMRRRQNKPNFNW